MKNSTNALIYPVLIVIILLGSFNISDSAAHDKYIDDVPVTDEQDVFFEASSNWESHFNTNGLLDNSILSSASFGSQYVYFGTSYGLSVQSTSGLWQTYTSSSGISGNVINDVERGKSANIITIGTDYGATVILNQGVPLDVQKQRYISYNSQDGVVSNSISATFFNSRKELWIGTGSLNSNGDESGSGVTVINTGNNLFLKSDDRIRQINLSNGQLTNNVIRDILEDSNNTMWVATGDGLIAFNGNSRTIYSTADGLPSNDIKDVHFRGIYMYVATDSGIAIMSGYLSHSNKRDDRWITYRGNANQLVDSRAKTINVDDAGNIWVGTLWLDDSSRSDTGAGVSVLTPGNQVFSKQDDQWSTFTGSQITNNTIRTVNTV